jgi:hypothetical protein
VSERRTLATCSSTLEPSGGEKQVHPFRIEGGIISELRVEVR